VTELGRDVNMVSDAQMMECLERLIVNAGQLNPPVGLSPLTHGLSLRVGSEYGVAHDGAIIIPHDFEVSSWQ
jgi:hypothetical protein